MMLFLEKALFLATTFSKVAQNSIFQLNLYQNFLKISKQFVFFVQTREKATHGLLKFLEKFAKIMDFLLFLMKYFLKFSRKFATICFVVQTREKLTRRI